MMVRSLVASCGLLALIASGMAQAQPMKLRHAWVVIPVNWGPILYEKKDVMRHYGKSYVVEDVRFAGSSQIVTAIATGELDVSALNYASFALAITNAKLDDIRFIADEVQDGVPGYDSLPYMVAKDGPIKTIADLKGKVLATNAIGAAMDMGNRMMLRKSGLEYNRDYTYVEVQFPNMVAAISQNRVVLGPVATPLSQDPKVNATLRPLFRQSDALGVVQLSALTARAGFIEKNRAVLIDYLEDYLRGVRWFMNPDNHKEAVAIVARVMKRPPEMFEGWIFTKRDLYRDLDGIPNVQAIQNNLDVHKDIGFRKEHIEVKNFVDLSLIREAAARIK